MGAIWIYPGICSDIGKVGCRKLDMRVLAARGCDGLALLEYGDGNIGEYQTRMRLQLVEAA